MALIDDLTRSISTELHRTLDQVIRKAVESYVVGNGRSNQWAGHSEKSEEAVQQSGRRGRPDHRRKSAKVSRENRSRTIINAVAKLGEASIEDVARVTGMDKRGVGSSLHYLAAAGKLKQAGTGKYKASRMARAAT